jgi:hypothetical protein
MKNVAATVTAGGNSSVVTLSTETAEVRGQALVPFACAILSKLQVRI